MTDTDNYLESVKAQFRLYKELAEKAIDQIEPDQLFYIQNENSNNIAVIIQHMHGNMISRWTDFLTTDGEKPWRERDGEFESKVTDKTGLMKLWQEGWECFFKAINGLTGNDLSKKVMIRNAGLSVMDAINRQLAHYAYHVGQIVFAAKELKTEEWNSLSIAKKKN